MTIRDEDIEKLLRTAPGPAPAAGLKEMLVAEIRLPQKPAASLRAFPSAGARGWLRRWWPVAAPAAASLALASVIAVQQTEIHTLRQQVDSLSLPSIAPVSTLAPTPSLPENPSPTPDVAAPADEIARLRQLADRLTPEVAGLERTNAENAMLRRRLAAPPGLELTAADVETMARARERAQRIACLNNMKQLGLAARLWSADKNGDYPTDVLQMTNELITPRILVCPADTAHSPASNWSSYIPANCSYEFLAPGASDSDPNRVLFRCTVHNHYCLVDGSVQSSILPVDLVKRDGKLYYEVKPAAGEKPPGAAPTNP
jgi:hypothetical protein